MRVVEGERGHGSPKRVHRLGLAREFAHEREDFGGNVLIRPEVSPHTWMYVSEPRYLMARIQEPRQRSPFAAPPGKTSLMLEIPCHVGDATWSASDDEIYARSMDDLERLGFSQVRAATLAVVTRSPRAGW